jgi:hypothetical protein
MNETAGALLGRTHMVAYCTRLVLSASTEAIKATRSTICADPHRHGRTRAALQTQEENQAPTNREQTQTGQADAGGERVDAMGSLPRPGPCIVASGGHDQEASRTNAVRGHVSSTNQPPQPDEPEPVPGDESKRDQKRGS